MKEFLKEFFELLGYCVLVICLFFAAYLLIANLYHYRELNSVEYRNFSSEANYNSVKDKISSIKSKINSSQVSTSAGTVLKGNFNECISVIESSKFYELSNSTTIKGTDIYLINFELYNTVNNKCLSSIIRNINTLDVKSASYEKIKSDVEGTRDRVLVYSDYLVNKSLGNSSYFYTTTISKYTIYNDLNSNVNLTISNYKDLATALEILADWYVSEYGGGQ